MKFFLLLLVTCFLLPITLPVTALAVENPQSSSPAVSATVPEFGRPDIPVLISPSNNATIASSAPNFIFNPSLGAVPVSHYHLWLDGKKNTDHIPQSFTTVTTQALTALAQGQHTWMIKAIGVNGNTRDSAIWSFTIDTSPPLILVTQIAQHQTNLSSLDPSTVPSGLFFATSQRQPNFSGQGEAAASLTVSLNGPLATSFTTTVSQERSFSLKPTLALISGDYLVTVSSTDPAGNTAVLPGFTLTITRPAALVIPLPSPLAPLVIPKPQLPFPPPLALPEILIASPEIRCPGNFLLLIIILIMTIYIIYLRYRIRRLKRSKDIKKDQL